MPDVVLDFAQFVQLAQLSPRQADVLRRAAPSKPRPYDRWLKLLFAADPETLRTGVRPLELGEGEGGAGLPAGGAVGQVLTYTGGGPVWATPTVPTPGLDLPPGEGVLTRREGALHMDDITTLSSGLPAQLHFTQTPVAGGGGAS